MAKGIRIIGVDPPCPRCDLTRQRVERMVREIGSSLNLRQMIYSDPDVRKFANSIGKDTGTARHVAEKAGIDMVWEHVCAVEEKLVKAKLG